MAVTAGSVHRPATGRSGSVVVRVVGPSSVPVAAEGPSQGCAQDGGARGWRQRARRLHGDWGARVALTQLCPPDADPCNETRNGPSRLDRETGRRVRLAEGTNAAYEARKVLPAPCSRHLRALRLAGEVDRSLLAARSFLGSDSTVAGRGDGRSGMHNGPRPQHVRRGPRANRCG
jgi:hypothetical protein